MIGAGHNWVEVFPAPKVIRETRFLFNQLLNVFRPDCARGRALLTRHKHLTTRHPCARKQFLGLGNRRQDASREISFPCVLGSAYYPSQRIQIDSYNHQLLRLYIY